MPLPHADRLNREHLMRIKLTEGLTTREIAADLGISQQSVNKFLRRRGWRTSASISVEELQSKIDYWAEYGLDDHAIAERVGRSVPYVKAIRNRTAP